MALTVPSDTIWRISLLSRVAVRRRVTSYSALVSRSLRSVSANSRALRMATAACPTKASRRSCSPAPRAKGLAPTSDRTAMRESPRTTGTASNEREAVAVKP